MYRPFMNDSTHLAMLDGQRYVVLRATGAVRQEWAELLVAVQDKLSGLDVSYPAVPHVTLLGVAEGTAVEALREVVTDWAASVPPLRLEVEKATVFPAPSQIAFVQIRKTPDLTLALSNLREQARHRGLTDIKAISPEDWTFHMTLAYCSALGPSQWDQVEPWLESLTARTVHTIASEAEIVAFDNRQETSGGVVSLGG
jgi:2'-5' RNA ligase